MTCVAPPVDAEGPVDRAQLMLARSSLSYMRGDARRSMAEAAAVLGEPGLPSSLHAAAEQRLVLAALHGRDVPVIGDRTSPSALLARAALTWRAGSVDDALELLWATRQAAGGNQTGAGYPALGLATVYAALGELDDAAACVDLASDEILLAGDPLWQAAPAVYCARIKLAAGQLDAATSAATAGVDVAGELGTPMLALIGNDVLATAAVCRGHLDEAARLHEQWPIGALTARLPFGTPNRRWMTVRLREARGDPVVGAGALDHGFDVIAADRALLLEEPAAAAWLVRCACRAGDQRRARGVATEIGRLGADNAHHPAIVAAAEHARGVADDDPEALASAAAGHRSPWAAASAAEDAAVALARRGDRRAARAWLERAAAGYLRCDASRDHARIRSRLRDVGVRRRHWSSQERPVVGWESLTETEHTVAHLVSEGLSNQQAAARMFLSRHTVDFHLRHIFRKLGIDSRVALTRVALTHTEQAS
jgi:DNA-binding CsgD family transcriptional regulator